MNAHMMTALHVAVASGIVASVKALLGSKNINTNLNAETGKTPLDLALESPSTNKDEIVLLLNMHSNFFFEQQSMSLAEDLTWRDALNQKDFDGFTPLLEAAADGNIVTLLPLLHNPYVDVNVTNDDDQTALHLAVQEGSTVCVKALLRNREIKVNKQNMWGETPLHLAAYYGHVECAKLLLDHKDIILNVKNNYNNTPFEESIRRTLPECLTILLNHCYDSVS